MFSYDQLTGEPRLLAPGRERRLGPRPAGCPFCAGNEESTPPELERVGGDAEGEHDAWRARAVPNLFPLGSHHEVLIPTPRHVTSTRELSVAEWDAGIELWQARSEHHASAYEDGCYVHLLVNDGAAAGASLEHTHAQLLVVPETDSARALYANCVTPEDCAACRLASSPDALVVRRDSEFVLLASPGPRVNEALLLIPRRHVTRLGDVPGPAFAEAMKHAVRALPDADFNCWVVQHGPAGAHWYVEFAPRTSHLAGVELALRIGVAIVDPVEAARRARERLGASTTAR